MKLSNKGRYAILALVDVTVSGGDNDEIQSRDIAERQGIPHRFLEQIFQDLKKAGLVRSKRGPAGGYRLARPAADISLGQVIAAVQGPVVLNAPSSDADAVQAATDEALTHLSKSVEHALSSLRLADVARRAEQLRSRTGPPSKYVYSI